MTTLPTSPVPRDRFADPTRSLTDHLEDLIRVDEILTRSFPGTTSADRIKAAVEILAVPGRKSQVVPLGPDLATADDVIAGRARYADTPGGHADRKTLRDEKALIVHLVYPDGPSLTAACGQSIDGRGHTGHYAADMKRDLRWGRDVCLACVQLLKTP